MHLGTFMYRDTFARVSVPVAFGTVRIDPLQHIALPPLHLRRLATDPTWRVYYYDQFTDLFDFGWGLSELGHDRPANDQAKTFFGLAHFQIQAAAAIVSGAYDFRGAVQSALLGTELSLKAGLAAHGVSTTELKSRELGHNLVVLAERLARFEARWDPVRVLGVLADFPAYVPNRYAAEQPSRTELGAILMGAQYVAAEVMRLFSSRDFRSCSTPPLERRYPPLRPA
jgi:hypothetical protein